MQVVPLASAATKGVPVHVIVVGCGRVGTELAGLLEQAGHSVAVIDKNPKAFRRLPPSFGGTTVVGLGFDREHLAEAGIDRAGAVAAVTSGDNSNILAARVAREHFGVERVVARIYDPRRAVIYQRLGISTVATVRWTTDQVLRRLLPGEEQPHEWVDPSGQVCMFEYDLAPAWAGKKLANLNEPGRWWLTALSRLGSAQVVDPNVIGQEGDVLMFVTAVDALDALRHRLDQGPEH